MNHAAVRMAGPVAQIARHDDSPIDQEVGVPGLRAIEQSYSTTDPNCQRYAQLERDDASGRDHSWFRKYDNFSGKRTSPDRYNRSILTLTLTLEVAVLLSSWSLD